MSSRIVALIAVPLVVLAWWAGVKTGQKGSSQAGEVLPVTSRPGTPVATFDGVSLSAEEVKAQLEEQTPFVRARYSSPEGRRDYLESLVRFELLAREAQKKGYGHDPDVMKQHKRNLVAVFVQKEFEEVQQKLPIDESELRSFYDSHAADYKRPERARLAVVLLEAPAADAARRKARAEEAKKLLAEAREKDAKDYSFFARLAQQHSDDAATRTAGGDQRFATREEISAKLGPEVADPAFGMTQMGTVLDRVVESPRGFWLLKLLGREAALDLKFEDVKDSIRGRLLYDRRSGAYQKFVDDLEKKSGLTINTALLESIKVEAPTLPPKGAIPRAPMERLMPGMPPGAPMPIPSPPPGSMPAK